MTLFSRISKDEEPYKKFKIELELPHISYDKKLPRNDIGWLEENYKSLCIRFDSTLYYTTSDGYVFFSLTLFGFGISVVKQTEL